MEPPRLTVKPRAIHWERMRSDEIEPQVVTVGGASNWKVATCPWWLEAEQKDSDIILRLRNCGQHDGDVWLRGDCGAQTIAVRADVSPSLATALRGGLRGLVGAALGNAIGFGIADVMMNTVGSAGGIVWILIWGVSAGTIWGGLVGGRRLALLSAIAGAIGVYMGLMTGFIASGGIAPATWKIVGGDLNWRVSHTIIQGTAVAIAGMTWGMIAMLGASVWSGRLVLTSAVAGAVAGAIKGAIWGGINEGVRDAVGFGVAGAIWGAVMGASLAPCRPRR